MRSAANGRRGKTTKNRTGASRQGTSPLAALLAAMILGPSLAMLSAPTAVATSTEVVNTELPAASRIAAVTLDEDIWLFGGRYDCSNPATCHRNGIYRYNTSVNDVEWIASLPVGRASMGAASAGQAIYLFGGTSFSTTCTCAAPTNQIMKYEPGKGEAIVLPTRLPTARSGTAVVAAGPVVYIFGGSGAEASTQILKFNPGGNSLQTLPVSIPPRIGATAIYDGHDIFLFGGGGSEIVRFSPANHSVTTLASIPGTSKGLSATYDGSSSVYLFGGLTPSETNGLRQIARYHIPSNEVRVLEVTLPAPARFNTVAAWSGGTGYVIGGDGDYVGYLREIVKFVPPMAGPPQSPTVAPGPGPGEVMLAWQPPLEDTLASPITRYLVYRGTTQGNAALVTSGDCANVTTTGCIDRGLPSGATRYYRVAAMTALGEGENTTFLAATTFRPPDAPVEVTAMPNGTRGVHLTWVPPEREVLRDGGFPILAYTLYRGTASEAPAFIARVENVTSYDDLPCAPAGLYVYQVSASTVAGEGPLSKVARSVGLNVDPQRIPAEACPDP